MRRDNRALLALAALLGLLVVVTSGCQSGDPALAERVTAQETRIADLEGKVGAMQTAVAQAPRAAATPAAPTPAPLPAVTGLTVNGTTKGADTAKVTITEYSDYL